MSEQQPPWDPQRRPDDGNVPPNGQPEQSGAPPSQPAGPGGHAAPPGPPAGQPGQWPPPTGRPPHEQPPYGQPAFAQTPPGQQPGPYGQPQNGQHPGYGQPGYGQPPYGQHPQYGQHPYGRPEQPRLQYAPYGGQLKPTRPPLTDRARRGSMIAGAVGFSLMTLGFYMVVIPMLIAAIGAFAGWIARMVAVRGEPSDALDARMVETWLQNAWDNAWWILLIVAAVGIIVWLAGYFLSVGIMRSHGVNHPVGVTWAGLGIAVAASWVLSWIGSFLWPLGFAGMDFSDRGPIVPAGVWIAPAVFGLIGVALHAGLGLLAWWWMAHAMRQRTDARSNGSAPDPRQQAQHVPQQPPRTPDPGSQYPGG